MKLLNWCNPLWVWTVTNFIEASSRDNWICMSKVKLREAVASYQGAYRCLQFMTVVLNLI